VLGNAGDDLLTGGAGNDIMHGGEGDDLLIGGTGGDSLCGDAGGDRLFGSEGDDTLQGEDGNDLLRGEAGNDQLEGGTGNDDINGGDDDDLLAGEDGNDLIGGGAGNDMLFGGAGHDLLWGDDGADTLQGGLGPDALWGGAGDDLLLSRSDGGEPDPAQGGARVNPPAADAAYDGMTGGSGADTFRFEFLMNAKPEIVAKHLNADGSIDWRGVAGENGAVHDHWVESIGQDVIGDYSRAEGDRILILGHTVQVDAIEHRDLNGDGVDESILWIISNQGASGAHNKDPLGSIVVFGDRVEAGDLTVNAGVHYGAYTYPSQAPYSEDWMLSAGMTH
jgi:Ca2+-binding RTX toxin-like protein